MDTPAYMKVPPHIVMALTALAYACHNHAEFAQWAQEKNMIRADAPVTGIHEDIHKSIFLILAEEPGEAIRNASLC